MKINELIWLYSIEHEHTKKINLVVIDKLAEVNVQNLLLELHDSFLWQTNIVIISMCYATDVIHYYFVYWEAFFNLYHTECILLMYVHLFNAVFVNHLCWYIGCSLFIFIALPHSVARICLFYASCGGWIFMLSLSCWVISLGSYWYLPGVTPPHLLLWASDSIREYAFLKPS